MLWSKDWIYILSVGFTSKQVKPTALESLATPGYGSASPMEVWIPLQSQVWLQSPHWQSLNPSKTMTPHPWAGR